ncbi:MAG: NAD(P)-binding domain-containing protein [Burkholderiaceae bacterium]|nr:NAD(P)-binding domain-containing protein [Burkholderiaceae bacterium]
MAKIAFIGVGNMGAPMANNLIKAGHQLCVYDLMPACMQAVPQGKAAATARETLDGAEFVISMLPESRHVESLYLGDQGLLAHVPKNAASDRLQHHIACEQPQSAHAASELGIAMIDAPVSGGTNGALNGTLTFIVGW